jgi:two-component sensor histidine kinase
VRAITERKQYERSLHELNTTLERRVLSSTSELKEREAMLQEIHHRVKNNLQVISSLINMQVRRLSDASSRLALQECQSRVQTMALIHEMLYQSKNYSSVQFSEYTRSLAANIFQATGVSPTTVALDLSIEALSLAVDKAIPCGLILNELITNALKHAFPNERGGVVHVKLAKVSDREILLSVTDDGIGLPTSFDMETSNSLGMQLVSTLVEQLEGHLEITRSGGTAFSVTFSAAAQS